MTSHPLLIAHLTLAATIAGIIWLPYVDSQDLYKDAWVGLIREVRP